MRERQSTLKLTVESRENDRIPRDLPGNRTLGALLFPGPIADRRPATVPHRHGLAAHAAPGSLREASVTLELRDAGGCHGGGAILVESGRKEQKESIPVL